MSDSLDRSTTWDSSIVRSSKALNGVTTTLAHHKLAPTWRRRYASSTWMEQAGHPSSPAAGHVVIDPNFIYDVGTMTQRHRGKVLGQVRAVSSRRDGSTRVWGLHLPRHRRVPRARVRRGGRNLVLWNPETGTKNTPRSGSRIGTRQRRLRTPWRTKSSWTRLRDGRSSCRARTHASVTSTLKRASCWRGSSSSRNVRSTMARTRGNA